MIGARIGPGADRPPDFEEYAAARRPDLVRLVVLLGLPPAHAAVLADQALHRAAARWADLREDPDPDARLLDLVLDEHARDRVRWWEAEDPASGLPEDLAHRLDRLPVGRRARVAWSVLGRDAASQHDSDPDPGDRGSALRAQVSSAVPGILVPPPTGAVPGRRGARGAPLLVALVVVLVVTGLGLSALLGPDAADPDEQPLGPVPVSERPNPAPVAWYADGRLHLDRVVVAIAGVRAVVELADGAVYVDDRGRVVRLLEDGARAELGRADPTAGLVASPVFGRVAWVRADGGGVEVVDVAAGAAQGTPVARRDFEARPDGAAPARGRLLRMAGSVLRYTESGREYEWDTGGRTFRSDQQDATQGLLVDAVGTTELRQVDDETIEVSQRYGRTLRVPGVGGEISPRQQFVLTRTGEGGTGVRVLSVATGQEVATGTGPDDVVLAARFTDADRITYLLADRAALPDASGAGRLSSTGPLEVRTCQVRTGACVVHAAGAGAGDSSALLGR